jgi:hypothetical protein
MVQQMFTFIWVFKARLPVFLHDVYYTEMSNYIASFPVHDVIHKHSETESDVHGANKVRNRSFVNFPQYILRELKTVHDHLLQHS